MQDLRNRGVMQIDLIVTDGHDGRTTLPSALCFPRRCASGAWCTSSRVLVNAVPHREHKAVGTELAGIWKQEKKEDALLNLVAENRQISEALSRSHPQLDRR